MDCATEGWEQDAAAHRAERAPHPEPRQDEVEAVARAIYAADARFGQTPWDRVRADVRERYRKLAIAALDAARRPDAECLRAAAKRVLEANMRGERDIDALNALEDAAGFSQQGQR